MSGIIETAVAGVLTAAVVGLFGWIYKINTRVVTLEAERANLDNLEKLMATKYDALKELIESKFNHMHDLLAASMPPAGRTPMRVRKDESRD